MLELGDCEEDGEKLIEAEGEREGEEDTETDGDLLMEDDGDGDTEDEALLNSSNIQEATKLDCGDDI